MDEGRLNNIESDIRELRGDIGKVRDDVKKNAATQNFMLGAGTVLGAALTMFGNVILGAIKHLGGP